MRSTSPTAALTRPGMRAFAWLLLTLLLIQAGAQWCAAHCGIAASGARVFVFVAPSGAVEDGDRSVDLLAASPVPAPDVPGPGGDGSANIEDPCPLVAWCELGQASLLPAAVAGQASERVTVLIRSPEAGPVLFQNMPGDRPPTA
jgi:hypothetical protein